jgi:hypothetical protein
LGVAHNRDAAYLRGGLSATPTGEAIRRPQ